MERTNTMNALDIMKRPAAYVSGYENTPTEEQNRAKQLCWEYNRTAPNEQEKRRSILQTLRMPCLLRSCHRPGAAQPRHWNLSTYYAGGKRLDRCKFHRLRRRYHRGRLGYRGGKRCHP